MAQLSEDCFAFGGPLMPVEEARHLIRARVAPVAEAESVSLLEALGRVLAADVVAPLPVPPFTNSAVDGFAVRYADLSPDGETRLPVVARVAAGHPALAGVPPGHAARVFTGAALPEGVDTVLMQEDCCLEGGWVTIQPGIRRGANRRLAGEDVTEGRVALDAGRCLAPADIGLAAALGLRTLPVRRRLAVALFSTGDEIREPGATLGAGQIYDANRFMIACFLARLNVAVRDGGILPDRADAIAEALAEAAGRDDLIITSGGVSTGEEDHVRAAVERLGSLFFWRLAVKPGRPVAMGQVGTTPFVGLPGNPVAAMITFMAVVRPLIEAMLGARPHVPARFPVAADFAYRKKRDRREYVRVTLCAGADGRLRACRFTREGAGVLTSLTETHGLVELPEALTTLAPGDTVDYIPFSEILA